MPRTSEAQRRLAQAFPGTTKEEKFPRTHAPQEDDQGRKRDGRRLLRLQESPLRPSLEHQQIAEGHIPAEARRKSPTASAPSARKDPARSPRAAGEMTRGVTTRAKRAKARSASPRISPRTKRAILGL